MEKVYRRVLVGLLLLQILWFFIPWGFAYPDGSDVALIWVGANSFISTQAIILISSALTALYVVVYAGLFFFKNWARLLLVLVGVLGGLGIPLYGLSVESGYEAMLGYFLTLGDGFVIAMSYFSNVSGKFVKGKS